MRKMLTVGLVVGLVAFLGADEALAKKCGKGGRKSKGCGDCCYSSCYTGCGTGGCGYVGGCAGGVCAMPQAVRVYHASATVIVDLPADAQLSVDGHQTVSTSAQRTFYTPGLETGETYSYTLQAQVTRDGQTQTVTEQITVRAGQTTRVTINLPAQGVAAR